jgi:N-methylhydantoinase A/oxoprolinase/acetone carboxylase beta subunit
VLLDGGDVLNAVKTATTEDVLSGIATALRDLLAPDAADPRAVDAVMIGTTHFTNAVVQRRSLRPVAAVRVGLPASASLPPFCDWPPDLAEIVDGGQYMLRGGHEYDGRPIVDFDTAAMREIAAQIRDSGVSAVGISAVFSPLIAKGEERAAEILREACPDISITLSHELGRLGLLERENVTLLNASLVDLATRTTDAFVRALADSGIDAPLYLTQNDGTIVRSEYAAAYPVYSFASGPTNSMRGAAFLSRLEEAIVVDVGGTTTDIGALRHGFPREANNVIDVGGVRTNFRMPDVLSIALGGGTMVRAEPLTVGPVSVGYELTRRACVFGGEELTATDIATAAGEIALGDPSRVAGLDRKLVAAAMARMHELISEAVDRMKPDAAELPLIAVGGGAFLIPDKVPGISRVAHVEHSPVANAVGAAIAQVSGEVDQIFQNLGRDVAIERARAQAEEKAERAGANPATIKLVEVEDLPLSYLPGNSLRVRVRVVGDITAVA